MQIPESFISISRDGRVAVVRADVREAVEAVCFEPYLVGEPLSVDGGRDTVLRFPLPDGDGVVRRYRRGGAMGRIVQEHYFLDNRPRRELTLTAQLHFAGVAVAEPLGAWWEWRGPWVRGALITRLIAGMDMLRYLEEEPVDLMVRLETAGRAIRAMHEYGVYHADLQLRNLLVTEDGIVILDFDNARLYSKLIRWDRARNLLRLRRSFQKADLPEDYFAALCTGYGELDWPAWLDGAYRLKGRLSDRLSGRTIR